MCGCPCASGVAAAYTSRPTRLSSASAASKRWARRYSLRPKAVLLRRASREKSRTKTTLRPSYTLTPARSVWLSVGMVGEVHRQRSTMSSAIASATAWVRVRARARVRARVRVRARARARAKAGVRVRVRVRVRARVKG